MPHKYLWQIFLLGLLWLILNGIFCWLGEKENKPRSLLSTTSTASLKTQEVVSEPNKATLSFPPEPLSPTGKKVLTGLGIGIIVEALSPGFFERRWQEIQEHWKKH